MCVKRWIVLVCDIFVVIVIVKYVVFIKIVQQIKSNVRHMQSIFAQATASAANVISTSPNFNPYMTHVLPYCYHLGESTVIIMNLGCDF